MTDRNYFTIKIPKGRRPNVKMLEKVYGGGAVFDYSDKSVSATCKVFLFWGIN